MGKYRLLAIASSLIYYVQNLPVSQVRSQCWTEHSQPRPDDKNVVSNLGESSGQDLQSRIHYLGLLKKIFCCDDFGPPETVSKHSLLYYWCITIGYKLPISGLVLAYFPTSKGSLPNFNRRTDYQRKNLLPVLYSGFTSLPDTCSLIPR